MKSVGFIGLGNMGMGMAKNILTAGFPLIAYDIREERVRKISELGAKEGKNPKDVAQGSRISIIMVLNFPQVEQVVLGDNGMLEGASPGDIIVVMSTIAPTEAKRLERAVEKKGVKLLDAAVSGGYLGAESGTLTIMIGGKKEVFESCRDILNTMGKNIYYLGPIGTGSTLKLVNQLLVGVNEVAVAEAMVLGVKAGLDPDVIFDVISKSAGDSWVFRNRVPRMINRDFTTLGELDILLKDLNIVLETGRSFKIPLVMSAVAKEIYQMANCMGFGKEDDSAVVKVIEKIAGIEL
jgi:2-hydroxymethylglutarate dehydrogenase